MDRDELFFRLARTRTALIRTYVLHVVWFAVMCLFTALQWRHDGLKASVLLTLLTVPPVLVYTVRAHRRPGAGAGDDGRSQPPSNPASSCR